MRFCTLGPRTCEPSLAYRSERGQEVAKLPGPQPALPLASSKRSVHTAPQPRLREASLPGEGVGYEDKPRADTFACKLPVGTSPHPHILGLLEGAGSPMPSQGVLGMVWTPWPVCGGASVFLGLGLHLLAGVRWGRDSGSRGPQMLPTLSLVSVGMRPWSRESITCLR